jgi:hypothetical protein
VVTSNNGIRAKYEKLITSPEERALYEEWSKLCYKKGTLDVMDLSRKSAGKIASIVGLKADAGAQGLRAVRRSDGVAASVASIRIRASKTEIG